MLRRIWIPLLALSLATSAIDVAAQKKRIEKAADLPRFTYAVPDSLETLIRDDAKWNAFAALVRRDDESVLAQYEIADKAAERQLLGVLVQLDFLAGRYDEALKGADRVRALQEKPADKLLSGMQVRAMVAAQKKVGDRTSEAWRAEVGRLIAAELAPLPYDVIQNEIKEAKASAEMVGEALVLGNIRDVLQPVASKAGALSSDLAPQVIAREIRARDTLAAQGQR